MIKKILNFGLYGTAKSGKILWLELKCFSAFYSSVGWIFQKVSKKIGFDLHFVGTSKYYFFQELRCLSWTLYAFSSFWLRYLFLVFHGSLVSTKAYSEKINDDQCSTGFLTFSEPALINFNSRNQLYSELNISDTLTPKSDFFCFK